MICNKIVSLSHNLFFSFLSFKPKNIFCTNPNKHRRINKTHGVRKIRANWFGMVSVKAVPQTKILIHQKHISTSTLKYLTKWEIWNYTMWHWFIPIVPIIINQSISSLIARSERTPMLGMSTNVQLQCALCNM